VVSELLTAALAPLFATQRSPRRVWYGSVPHPSWCQWTGVISILGLDFVVLTGM